jgi:ketosteroid isomerase-like protein
MKLPSPIQAYFDADRSGNGDALIRAFAPDAVVEDEGQTHAGRPAIAAWWRATKEKYQTVVEPLETREKGDVSTVAARVTGRFPGSPAILSFAFRLSGEQIKTLEIGA